MTEVIIPDNVSSINSGAFRGCSSLSSIYISNNVKSISNYAFDHCSNLTSVTIPNGVTSIGNQAFSSCFGLSSLIIPSSVVSIGDNAFSWFKGDYINLSKCMELPEIMVDRSNGIFNGVSESTRIYLPGSKGHSDGGEKNVIIGDKCTTGIKLVDGQGFENPVEFESDGVSFDRTFTSDVIATVCLPYTIAASKVTGGKFYSFGGVSSDYVVTMNEVTGDIQANTPYLFVPSATAMTFEGSVTVGIVDNTTSTSTSNGNWTFCGTYEKIIWATEEDFGGDAIYGYAANAYGDNVNAGDFVRVEASVNSCINPYRAYLKFPITSSARHLSSMGLLPSRMKVRLVDFSGNITHIKNIGEEKETSDVWYTIEGKPMTAEPMQKGVYIKNGVKIVR